MTLPAFEENRLIVMWYSSNMTDIMQKKMQLGQNWKSDLFKIYVLNRYLDIYLEYSPQSLADYTVENTNFFSVEDMLLIQEKINDILNTDFNLTFYLTT